MPYNKGDFTQQGVNGDVSALVRLNEKRVMKVVLSSDDESDNCDISGKVYDLLNGTSYDIGSGGGGGEDIRKCTVTWVNSSNTAGVIQYFTIENGMLCLVYADIEANGQVVLDYCYGLFPGDICMVFNFVESLPEDVATVAITDAVNVTYDIDTLTILVTDPTIDSSFTITYDV